MSDKINELEKRIEKLEKAIQYLINLRSNDRMHEAIGMRSPY